MLAAFPSRKFKGKERLWEGRIGNVIKHTVSNETGNIETVALAGSPTLAYNNAVPAALVVSTNCPSDKIWNWPAVRYDVRRAMPGASVGAVWRYELFFVNHFKSVF